MASEPLAAMGTCAGVESELLTGGEWQDVVVELELTEDVGFVVFELLFEGKGSVRLDALQAMPIQRVSSDEAGG